MSNQGAGLKDNLIEQFNIQSGLKFNICDTEKVENLLKYRELCT